MGGRILDHEAKRLFNEGRQEGLQEARAEIIRELADKGLLELTALSPSEQGKAECKLRVAKEAATELHRDGWSVDEIVDVIKTVIDMEDVVKSWLGEDGV